METTSMDQHTDQPTPHEKAPVQPWQALARDGQPHPTWWHTVNAAAWTGALGTGVSALHLSDPALLAGSFGAAFLAMGVGAACVHAPDPEHRGLVNASAAFGAVTGAAAGAWTWLATRADLFHHLWQPGPWAALAIGGVTLGAAYTALRLRIAVHRDPGSAANRRAKLKTARSEWSRIMATAGFGEGCEVMSRTDNWSGYRVLIRLDPDTTASVATVASAREKLTVIAARVLSEEDSTVTLAADALTVERTEAADVVSIRVRLRQVLTSTVEPPAETGPVTDPAAPLVFGLWEDGEEITAPESGPHGVAIGASGSGKSTYLHGMVAQRSRRKHLVTWVAGVSKFEAFIGPWIAAVNAGAAARPVFDMIGGGSGGTDAEFWSAASVLAALHTLMTHRMASPDTPRKDGNLIVSGAHPRALAILDEVDALLKWKVKNERGELVTPKFDLPSGRSLSAWEMIVDLGSKGRSEGCELELASQRLTDAFWGTNVMSYLANVARRAAFRTNSSHDAASLLKGTKLDSCTLRHNAMYLALSEGTPPIAGKAAFYNADVLREYAARADAADTIGCLSGAEAAALGDLYSQRWTADRIGTVAAYFGGRIGDLVTVSADTAGEAKTGAPASPAGPRQDGRQRLRDAVARARRECPETAALEKLWSLPTVEEPERNRGADDALTVPETPATVAEATSLRTRILLTVKAAGSVGISRADLLAALPGAAPKTVSNNLTTLVQEGVLVRTDGGYRYTG
jgi:hypothetical protein